MAGCMRFPTALELLHGLSQRLMAIHLMSIGVILSAVNGFSHKSIASEEELIAIGLEICINDAVFPRPFAVSFPRNYEVVVVPPPSVSYTHLRAHETRHDL